MSVRRVVPKPPQTQALSSTTFRPPPLDGTLSLAEQYDWHLKNTPNHPLFIYARSDQSIRTILWPEAVRAIHEGARLVRKAMNWTPGNLDVPVAAILAASGEVEFFASTTLCSLITINLIRYHNLLRNVDIHNASRIHPLPDFS